MKTNLLMTMAAGAMILAGCANDDNGAGDNWNGEIRLSSGVTEQRTRANNADVPDRQIAENQAVKVIVTKEAGDQKEYAGYSLDFTADGNGGLTNATAMYYPASGLGVNIYAYHPADALSSFSVQEDQSAEGNYYKSDLLYSAKKDYARQKANHSLTFIHKLCKVEYALEPGSGSPVIEGSTVQWMNVDKTIAFTAADGTVATPSDVATITPHATYGAVIVPQTVAAGTQLLKVTLANGGELYYKPAADQVFESGKKYKYTITANLTGLTVTSTITDWDAVGGKTGTAEME